MKDKKRRVPLAGLHHCDGGATNARQFGQPSLRHSLRDTDSSKFGHDLSGKVLRIFQLQGFETALDSISAPRHYSDRFGHQ